MSHPVNFKRHVVVSCAVMRPELERLREDGFLNPAKVLYTSPGLHENPRELEKQLKRQLKNAKRHSENIIVIYGKRCYIDISNLFRDIDKLLQEEGGNIKRINAANCIDMLASAAEREQISAGKRIYWLSPGWVEYWRQIFKDWDIGKANETFPQNDKALILDSLGIYEKYSADSPEKILEFADWMKLGVESYKISLDRLKALLTDAVN